MADPYEVLGLRSLILASGSSNPLSQYCSPPSEERAAGRPDAKVPTPLCVKTFAHWYKTRDRRAVERRKNTSLH